MFNMYESKDQLDEEHFLKTATVIKIMILLLPVRVRNLNLFSHFSTLYSFMLLESHVLDLFS